MKYSFKHNKGKWIATIVVSAFFIYFWVFGPLMLNSNALFETDIDQHFVNPILISEKSNISKHKVKSVGEYSTKGKGYKLISNKEKLTFGHKILSFNQDIISDSKYGQSLLKNAIKLFSSPTAQFTLKQTEHLFYIEIKYGTTNAYYLQSKGLTDHIKGYSGPINIGVFLNENAKLTQLHLVSSSETKSYLNKIAKTNYYQQYNGQSIHKIHEIDAISGATITTKAIALTASELIQTGYPNPIENLTDKMGISNYEVIAKLTIKWLFHISVILILFLYAFQKKITEK